MLTDVRSERVRSSRKQCDEIRARTAGGQNAARTGGKSENFAGPRDDRALDIDGGVLSSADVTVHRCRQKFGQGARRRAGSVHPTEKSRVNVAGRIGRDRFAEFAVDVVERRGFARECCGDPFAHVDGNRPPRRALAHALQTVDRVVDRCVR